MMSKEYIQYLILILGTIGVSIVLSILARKAINLFITKGTSRLKTDPTNFLFLKNSVSFIIYTIAIIFIFYKIPFLKSIGAALFAGAGIVALVIGFASQKALTNIVSGIFILIFKPFKISDTIQFKDGSKGIVEEITLRHTLIREYENRRIIIPNSIISEETIINSSILDEKIKAHIVFSISYDSDINKAIEIIRDESIKHELSLDQRSESEMKDGISPVTIRVIALSDYSVDIKAYVWAKNNDDAFIMKCDLYKTVKERFDREGIEIPFPYRTIVHKNMPEN